MLSVLKINDQVTILSNPKRGPIRIYVLTNKSSKEVVMTLGASNQIFVVEAEDKNAAK